MTPFDPTLLTHDDLKSLSTPIAEALTLTPYTPPESNPVSIKSHLQSLLPSQTPPPQHNLRRQILDFVLCCAALASADGESPSLCWIPKDLSAAAVSAVEEVSRMVKGVGMEVGMEVERRFLEAVMDEVFPILKRVIKESCVDVGNESVVSSTVSAPVAYAVVAVHQFRWFVMQVNYPHLGKLCPLVIPCALTALDHWSAEVKDQGMVCFIHLTKNVNAAELSCYEEPILDVCCRNIASSDELWYHVVEMSVLALTTILQRNPRNHWFEKILIEMLSHLERQPTNNDRRTSWLVLIDPVLDAMGLVLLAHFRRIFLLFFQWLNTDDDKTVVLVLERICTIVKLTWVRRSPYFDKLLDKLIILYKEAAMRKEREAIRTNIIQILILLKKCKGLQFEEAWGKYKEDPDLPSLTQHEVDTTSI